MQHEQQIMIAGMGRMGASVAAFMAASDVAAACCDDNGDYPRCDQAMLPHAGFIFKSPGMAAARLFGINDGGVNDDVQVINDIELLLRLSFNPVILVTGTNGKSTVVGMVEAILHANGIAAIACGNNGLAVLTAWQQQPAVYVIELSSYQLENLFSQQAAAAVVLNIGVDHTDRYADLDAYQAVKESIYRHAACAVRR